ncbi:MAG: 7-carboxy-7-deazaguanine synthase [Planctomycetota bacterium]
MKTYVVKEVFGPTLQGEGLHVGMACMFVRLAGCNAWDGRPETRAASACPYCDTDFRGGNSMDVDAIVAALHSRSTNHKPRTVNIGCVLSGGEPLLQADAALLEALGRSFAWVDVETNGTRSCPAHPANVFISCSPKQVAGEPIVLVPDWWKVLIPDQEAFLERALSSGKPVFVQPTCPDAGPVGPMYAANLQRCVQLCVERGCRMSLQLHKYLGLP